MSPIIYILLLIFQVYESNTSKILSIIPSASKTHHLPFQPLWRELAQRGHEVTVITTDPQKNDSIKNLKELDMSYCYEINQKHDLLNVMSSENKSYFDIAAVLGQCFRECHDHILSSPDVQEMIHNKEIKFDLLIVEAQLPSMLAFAWRFQCPVIAVASLEPSLQFHDSLGNLIHPVTNPDHNLDVEEGNMSFMDRLKSLFYVVVFKWFVYTKAYPRHHVHMQQYFGEDLPPLKELQDNISMMFVGTHPLFQNMRLSNLNTISIGSGMHFTPAKDLPFDLQKFLDEASEGVIYFSLGSNVNSNLLTDTFKKAIVEAFAEVPYKVLLKMDGELQGVSKNVLVRKWMPQQDILRHKNVKLFITQGGLQSLQESVVNGIPLIGIPFFGDQITNVNKMVKKGYGLRVDRRTISKDMLVSTITEVIQNGRYRETAKMMGEIFRDEELPSLQKAVYWTEYVIRHNGAKHLRSPAIGMPAWKYYMLDVVGFLILVLIVFLFLVYLLVKATLRFIRYVFVRFLRGPETAGRQKEKTAGRKEKKQKIKKN